MNIRLGVGGEEEEPIFFDLRAGIGRIARQLCESWVGP